MRTRIGIELSPIDCRIVEIGVSGHAETRVISYSISPRASAETRVQLARLQGRQAAVVVWGTRGDHRQAIVNADDYNSMRREALNALQSAGVDTYGALTDIAPAGPRARANGRRPVVMAIASKSDVSAAVRPLVAAGIKIKSIVTPAIALGSLARLRCGGGALHGVEAYVALEQSATCLTLVRNQLLVAARELPWGYVDEHEPVGDAVPRDKFATRLSAELVDFFADAGIDANAVNVCICGSLPGLRTMTAAIVERLDVEIEPLDSLFGIDVDRLPPGAELCERAVELRLAWAVATDWKAPLNLLRDRQRQATAAVLAQAAVVAGIGAGVTLGWGLRQTSWLERATHVPTTFKRMSVRPKIQLPTVVDMSPMPIVRREPIRIEPPPIMHEPVIVASIGRQSAVAIEPDISTDVGAEASVETTTAERDDVELDSILFGRERKLAVIDGRIVEAGDEVGGVQIVEIATTTVTFRDRSGRLQKLPLGRKRN